MSAMWRGLQVPRQGHYAWRNRGTSYRVVENEGKEISPWSEKAAERYRRPPGLFGARREVPEPYL